MKRIFLSLLLSSLLISAPITPLAGQTLTNGARGFPQPNDTTTGTTLNGSAIINGSGNAINAGTSNTTVPTYIVIGNAGISGNAVLAYGGVASATMDSTIASGAGNYYVVNSTTTAKEFHAQSTPPTVGTWVVGFLHDSSTTSGSTALVDVNGFFYGSSGSNSPTLTTWNLTLPTSAGTTFAQGTANRINIQVIPIPWNITFSHIYLYITTADGTNASSWGLYSYSGTTATPICTTTAAVESGTGIVSATNAACSQGTVSVTPGNYIWMSTGAGTTMAFDGGNLSHGVIIPFSSNQLGAAATAGQVPTTAATLPSAGTVAASVLPNALFE